MFPNLDHVFAGYEQQLFHLQPALLFSQKISNAVFSELMHLGYASYFPLIALVTLYYFFYRYQEFLRIEFIILAAFMIYYVIFVLLPVTGPQYYYFAAGVDQIAQGNFPNVGDYFATHSEPLPIPGWKDGFFYQCVASAHEAGERPTAAFPSSHVGMSTVTMIVACNTRNRILFFCLLPFYALLCLATVYIMAHYCVDSIGGFVTACLLYYIFNKLYRKIHS
jgi:membrane-associated phospholipid phosphatase